jgi:hypothetical protein
MTLLFVGVFILAQTVLPAAPIISTLQDAKTFTGMLVDYNDETLTVENDDDEYNVETMIFRFDEKTQFFYGEDPATIDDLSLYDDVKIEYTGEDDNPLALKVIIVPYEEEPQVS